MAGKRSGFHAAQDALRASGGPPLVWESARLPEHRIDPANPPLCESERCAGLEHPAAWVVRMWMAADPADRFQFYACPECHTLMLMGTRPERSV